MCVSPRRPVPFSLPTSIPCPSSLRTLARGKEQELTVPQEIFDKDHRVVSQRGNQEGRFTFTAADAGDHQLCFTPSSNSGRSAWKNVRAANGGIRLHLDLAIGETSALEGKDKGKMEDIASRVKDLNARLGDIRREQVFQRVSPLAPLFAYFAVALPHDDIPLRFETRREANAPQEREAEFRDHSEATNSRVIRWIVIQLVILTGTTAWQLSHLRSFFIKQKLT